MISGVPKVLTSPSRKCAQLCVRRRVQAVTHNLIILTEDVTAVTNPKVPTATTVLEAIPTEAPTHTNQTIHRMSILQLFNSRLQGIDYAHNTSLCHTRQGSHGRLVPASEMFGIMYVGVPRETFESAIAV
jgi:hypothetical protein